MPHELRREAGVGLKRELRKHHIKRLAYLLTIVLQPNHTLNSAASKVLGDLPRAWPVGV